MSTLEYNANHKSRLWSKISITDDPDACWLWLAHTDKDGYGIIKWQGKNNRATRIIYELTNDKPPNGMKVLHKCDNPSCCNPKHLFLGTALMNNQDRALKGRSNRDSKSRWNAKLTPSKADEIRTKYATGAVSQAELGKQYNVTQSVIWRIIRGISWKTR